MASIWGSDLSLNLWLRFTEKFYGWSLCISFRDKTWDKVSYYGLGPRFIVKVWGLCYKAKI
jgi:hypothetical protein